MTVWGRVRLYSCAIVFAVWAAVRSFGTLSNAVAVGFLAAAAVAFVVAEIERTRQRRRARDC